MQASIDIKGNLTIWADTDLEAYALKKWYTDWCEDKVTLGISGVLKEPLIVGSTSQNSDVNKD